MPLSILRVYRADDSINEYGAVAGIRNGRGNWSTLRKPSQYHFDLTWNWTEAAAVGSWGMATWAVLNYLFFSKTNTTSY